MSVYNNIVLKDLDSIHEFVKLADYCLFDVNIGYDRVMIDAKSIVGVMGLDLQRKLTVQFDGESTPLHDFLLNHTAE